MKKRKTLEEWKGELVGKKFGRLTVLEVQQHYKNSSGKKSGFEVICRCVCDNTKIVPLDTLFSCKNISCGCLKKELMRENIEKAILWQKDHPHETDRIRRQNLDKANVWRKEHPEEAKNISLCALEKAQEQIKTKREQCPEKYKQVSKKNLEKAFLWREEHPEESRYISRLTIKKAHQWSKEHPEENRLRIKNLIEKGKIWRDTHPYIVKKMALKALHKANQWHKEYPELSLRYRQHAAKFMLEKRVTYPDLYSSKEENEICAFLRSLGFLIERQFLLDGHYYDFKINNFLIEYHGSVYHYTKYENRNNQKAKSPRSKIKDRYYHKYLRDLAIKNGYSLIQVWDYDWINNKEFIQTLITEQLKGIAHYKDYIKEGLLDNNYGFKIDGEQVEPKGIWISTSNPKEVVEESYPKGKVLVYNSGYTHVC